MFHVLKKFSFKEVRLETHSGNGGWYVCFNINAVAKAKTRQTGKPSPKNRFYQWLMAHYNQNGRIRPSGEIIRKTAHMESAKYW